MVNTSDEKVSIYINVFFNNLCWYQKSEKLFYFLNQKFLFQILIYWANCKCYFFIQKLRNDESEEPMNTSRIVFLYNLRHNYFCKQQIKGITKN